MLKGKWILALFLIVLAAACGDKSTPPGPVADTPENRKAAAKHYLQAVPPQELLKNISGNMAQRMPEPVRKQLQEALADKELIDKTYQISEASLVKHFTPDELNAMAAFFGSPAGKSARAKFSPYMNEIMPQVNAEMKKAFDKVKGKAAEKEGAPAAEQAKPEPPKAAPPPPEAVKPETPQPKPEKPEVKQPKAEPSPPEKPKNK